MFNILFGWRKASKCKKLIKRAQCRFKVLKNKRSSIVRQIREDVAQLIKIGYEDVAYKRVDQLFKDESIMAVYELLDNFCGFIILNLSYIRRNKDCPNDINEAMSSLIFASARCGDLPELLATRKLFRERYGEKFEKTALELLPGNLVNSQLINKLSVVSVTDDMKERLVDEIAKEHCVRSEILAIEYPSELQPQLSVVSVADDMKEILVDEIAKGHCTLSEILAIEYPSELQQQQVNSIEEPQMEASNGNDIEESKVLASSPESLLHPAEDMIVYLDYIEEFPSSTGKEGSFQDQRIFKFKSSPFPRSGKIEDSADESRNAMSSTLSFRKKVTTTRKRLRCRTMPLRNARMEGGHSSYYESPCKFSPMHRYRVHSHYKQPKKNPEGKMEELGYAANTKSQSASIRCFNQEGESCCLNHPSYFCADDGRHNQKTLPWKQNTGLKAAYDLEQKHKSFHFHHCQSKLETECQTLSRRQSTTSCKLGNGLDHNAKPDCQPDELGKIGEGKEIASWNGTSPLTGRQMKACYTRTMTMPQERPKDRQSDQVARSKSFPIQSPAHVHPKLPDYDDIAAKFMAFKKVYLQKRASGVEAVA